MLVFIAMQESSTLSAIHPFLCGVLVGSAFVGSLSFFCSHRKCNSKAFKVDEDAFDLRPKRSQDCARHINVCRADEQPAMTNQQNQYDDLALGPNPAVFNASFAPSNTSCCLLLHHVTKHNNIGMMVRTAAALGAKEVIFVGARKMREVSLFGAHGAERRVAIRCFNDMRAAKEYFDAGGSDGDTYYEVTGIEIDDAAVSISDDAEFLCHLLQGKKADTAEKKQKTKKCVCFMPGNEGMGLMTEEKENCRWMCYIPQHSDATASLNVSVATGIVLQRAAAVLKQPQSARIGDKFVVKSVEALREEKKMLAFDECNEKKRDHRRRQEVSAPDSLDINVLFD